MPSIASQEPVISRTVLQAMLAAVFARPAGPILGTGTVKLFTAGPSPITPDSNVGEFTNADFNGYAGVTLTGFAAQVVTPNGDNLAGAGSALFTVGTGATPNTILGYWIEEDSTILQAEYFPVPIPMINPGDYIDLLVLCPLRFIPDTGANS